MLLGSLVIISGDKYFYSCYLPINTKISASLSKFEVKTIPFRLNENQMKIMH